MKVQSTHQRIEWIDVAKGLGIIAVVLGHFYPRNTTFYESLYWWHMPLFFMIGGFFVKPTTLPTLRDYLRRRFWPMFKQYFGYGVGLILLNLWLSNARLHLPWIICGDWFMAEPN
ncbi:acyltransferase family protein [Lacticaseibacillus casei]|uniref:acyltransferase family protein n=1 Tax=Lacticaseibacillus casei TaxID=1582 RepID=UPI000A4351DD|nr:acyltransferase family protein [Lacticaseibacillus casei]MDZ5494822.1 acyltransferase family protein [Lacticaseibacillus casei]